MAHLLPPPSDSSHPNLLQLLFCSFICPPIWLWMLDNLITDKEKTWNNRSVVRQKGTENTMNVEVLEKKNGKIRKWQLKFIGHIMEKYGWKIWSSRGQIEDKRDCCKQRQTYLESLCKWIANQILGEINRKCFSRRRNTKRRSALGIAKAASKNLSEVLRNKYWNVM